MKNLSTPELHYIASALRGEISIRPNSNFTANDLIALRVKIDDEIASRKGCAIPPDWREQAQAYIDAGHPITEFAPSAELRKAEARKSKIEANRLAALPANDLLGELGL